MRYILIIIGIIIVVVTVESAYCEWEDMIQSSRSGSESVEDGGETRHLSM
jgi:hypothetical protein